MSRARSAASRRTWLRSSPPSHGQEQDDRAFSCIVAAYSEGGGTVYERARPRDRHRQPGQFRAIVEAMRPMTVRQVFYQATVKGLVEKSEAGYGKVQTDLALMRRDGELPYDWLVDNTRSPSSLTRANSAA